MSQKTLLEPTVDSEASEQKLTDLKQYRMGLAYGRFVYRARWWMVAFWLLVVIASAPLLLKIGAVLQGGGYTNTQSESSQASDLLNSRLHQPGTTLLVIFQAPKTSVSDAAYQQELSAFDGRARSFPSVSAVTNGSMGRDGRSTFVSVDFTSGDLSNAQIENFHKLLPTAGPAQTYIVGNALATQEYIQTTLQDARTTKAIALPLALIVLLIVFGSLVAGLMPLLLSLVAVIVSLALIAFIGQYVFVGIFVISVVSITGLGISIDYSLFIIRRYREELARGLPVSEAIAWTLATAGESILFSGLIVVIGFTGLLILGVPFLNPFGMGGAVVVGVAVLAALTLLPAVLSLLGTKVNAGRIPYLSRYVGVEPRTARATGSASEAGAGFWQRWALGVMRRPLLVLLAVSVLLLGLGWPVLSLNIGTPDTSALPKGTQTRTAFEIIRAQFPDLTQQPIQVVVQAPAGSSMLTTENLVRLDSLTKWLMAQPHVSSVSSLTHLPSQSGSVLPVGGQQLYTLYTSGAYQRSPLLARYVASTTGGDTTLISVRTDAPMESAMGKDLIIHLRTGHEAAARGLRVLIGGAQAGSLDFTSYLYGRFPLAIAFIVITTFVLLLLMFRSLLLPLKAIIMNVLSIGVAYGVLVFIFQWGHFANALNFTASGFIDSPVPLLLFCSLFGLSMDYEVFLLSRVREEWLRTHDNTQAVISGLEKTGGVITSAALLFILIAGSSTFSSLITSQEYGLGLSVAVLVDATVIRVLLVPAAMRLMGRWNWWLPGQKRVA